MLGSSTTPAAANTPSSSSKVPPEGSSASMHHLGAGLSAQEYEHTLTRLLNQKRPWTNRRLSSSARVSSWADPVSARDRDEKGSEAESGSARDHEEEDRRKPGTGSAAEVYENVEEEGLESDMSQLGGASDAAKGKRKEKARFHSLLSVVSGEGVLAEEHLESSGDEDFSEDEEVVVVDEMQLMHRRKPVGFDPRR